MLTNKTFLQIARRCKPVLAKNYCQKISNIQQKCKEIPLKQTLGQPAHETHPQLISEGELTPMITREEYQSRRSKLLEKIVRFAAKSKPEIKQHLVKEIKIVIPSATKQYMSDKIPYVFRQNTDFLYLTGCQEPDSCLVLTSVADVTSSILFIREKDEHAELWDGPRTGPKIGQYYFGVNQCLPTSELENFIYSFRKTYENAVLWCDYSNPIHKSIHVIMSECYTNLANKALWENPKVLIHNLRLIKSPSEIKLMKKTCEIASDAITETIRHSKPDFSEHQIFAKVDYECRMNGAQYLAYPPVVAGGNRANFIHYINNDQIVRDGEMILMDAGCEYGGYTSDITRTWPINGHFTTEQKELYDVVYDTQIELIKLCNNLPTLDSLFNSMCLLLGKHLQKIGLISSTANQKEMVRAAYTFCPHHVSHYLGMDVHDTPLIGRNIKICPGMVITIEPGIYINYKHNVPCQYQGLGIRIEDDILITESGPVVLTNRCPKSREDIEHVASDR